MVWRLPPLNALKAFEAVARHGSFTKAADDLCVTPGAVSRQVQVLEQHLGVSLFDRKNREVVPTMQGERYHSVVSAAFNDINHATSQLRRDMSLHVSCYMTLSLCWLLPRLPAFHAANPNYSLMFSTTPPKIDEVASGAIDVALLFGDGNWTGVEAHKMFPNELVPVCSPEFKQKNDLSDPDKLSEVTLLHSQMRPSDWTMWVGGVEAPSVNPMAGMIFESSALAYEAAAKGIGVAMGLRALVDQEIEKGKLVQAFDHVLHDGQFCYLAYSEKLSDNVRVKKFRDWVLSESETYQKTPIWSSEASLEAVS